LDQVAWEVQSDDGRKKYGAFYKVNLGTLGETGTIQILPKKCVSRTVSLGLRGTIDFYRFCGQLAGDMTYRIVIRF
jgi:hypothetical protein